MAITIDRTGITLTNDTGTPSSPVGDGTMLSAADRVAVLDAIDDLFDGTRSATFTLGTLLQADGGGTHLFSAGVTGGNVLRVRNTSAGTGNYARVEVLNNSSVGGYFGVGSSTATFGDPTPASGLGVYSDGSGGMVLGATHASGTVRFISGGTTERMRLTTGGLFNISDGTAAAPGLGWLNDTDCGWYRAGANDLGLALGGVRVMRFTNGTSLNFVSLEGIALGTGAVTGPSLSLGRNTSGNGATPTISFTLRSGVSARYVYVDSSGDVRIHTAAPTEDNSTVAESAGTVVGTQTSLRATKRLIRRFRDTRGALKLIAATPLYSFQYRETGDRDTHHVGIMADESPRFTRYGGRVFDPVNAFGYTAAAIQALLARVEALESALAAR